jgi:hypothetical protein
MPNRDILVARLRGLWYVRSVSLEPLPSGMDAFHPEPALVLRCNFTDVSYGARAELYLREALLDNLEAHDAIVENVAKLFTKFSPPWIPAEGFDPANPEATNPQIPRTVL